MIDVNMLAIAMLNVIAQVSGSSDGPPIWLLAAGPAGAVGVYVALFQYYRNTKKSHSFEHETRIEVQPVTGSDQKVDEIKGTRKSAIDGDNRNDHRRRVQRY